MEVRELAPKVLWNHFSDLNAVPRPSKKEERVRQFLLDFGNSLGLKTTHDAIGNVVIKKTATTGFEDRPTVVLQGHMDMVHQKNNDTVFDFDKEGIKMYVDGDWVKAHGTTLGADNGIGVAAIMSILSSKDIAHPAIEALITVDEETGMTGAMQIDSSILQGKILLNLDTEDERELTVGCAGGIDLTTEYAYQQENILPESQFFQINVKGLKGGHSGAEINLGRANANKLMNRLLFQLWKKIPFQLVEINGGSLRNAIPRESISTVAVKCNDVNAFKTEITSFLTTIQNEFKAVEKSLTIVVESTQIDNVKAVAPEDLKKILQSIYADPNGVYRMSPEIEGFVETSSNLARVIVKDGNFHTESLLRSGVESTKYDIVNAIQSNFENIGATVSLSGDYPGWEPNPNSPLVHFMEKTYKEVFQNEPQVQACHAGLECGLLGAKFEGMQMISFGPNLLSPHSPDERVQISSVQRFYDFLLHILKEIPADLDK
ncbi:aminoacyl-histidine dipeptidase [Rhizosphaericola mali]|uniref:Cytosol non-specific dipeptidase n=1 Tax=Rhizosphaericola mali TaxID=2545455 RepID=A0A5P2G1E4_9BACT|nr:aminoacyl-histidine dipeptidase [Rhizosphaericola mali]QES87919.1 aminoacyl-histidine dipeptidase [Rhizosphaericola mali]